ncbi:hypothetical protein [Dactylosporangium sp. NPDC051541]|uniref:hypothetical protein n=1 Tax=Dactylosporangium sp. NPDC051541 TaxID=3363977 RepID=UPI00378EAAD1
MAATAPYDGGAVRVWDLDTGALRHRLPIEDAVRSLALGDDGTLVAGVVRGLVVLRLR